LSLHRGVPYDISHTPTGLGVYIDVVVCKRCAPFSPPHSAFPYCIYVAFSSSLGRSASMVGHGPNELPTLTRLVCLSINGPQGLSCDPNLERVFAYSWPLPPHRGHDTFYVGRLAQIRKGYNSPGMGTRLSRSPETQPTTPCMFRYRFFVPCRCNAGAFPRNCRTRLPIVCPFVPFSPPMCPYTRLFTL